MLENRKKNVAVLLATVMVVSIGAATIIGPATGQQGVSPDWNNGDTADAVVDSGDYVYTASDDGTDTKVTMYGSDGTNHSTVTITGEVLSDEDAFIQASDGNLYLITDASGTLNVYSIAPDTGNNALGSPTSEASGVSVDGDALAEYGGNFYFTNGSSVTHSSSADPGAGSDITTSITNVQGLDSDRSESHVVASGDSQSVEVISGTSVDQTVDMSTVIDTNNIGDNIAAAANIIYAGTTSQDHVGTYSLLTDTTEARYATASYNDFDAFEKYFAVVGGDGTVEVYDAAEAEQVYESTDLGSGASADFGSATGSEVTMGVGGSGDTARYTFNIDRVYDNDHNVYVEDNSGTVYDSSGSQVSDPRDEGGESASADVTITDYDNTREDGVVIAYDVDFDSSVDGSYTEVLVDVNTSDIEPDSYAVYADGVYQDEITASDFNSESNTTIVESNFTNIDSSKTYEVTLRSHTDDGTVGTGSSTTFETSQTQTLSGYVYDGEGNTVENASIKATLDGDESDLRGTTSTNESGYYEMDLDDNADYFVTAEKNNSTNSATITMSGSDVTQDFTLVDSTGDSDGNLAASVDAVNSDVTAVELRNPSGDDTTADEGVVVPGMEHELEITVQDDNGLNNVQQVKFVAERDSAADVVNGASGQLGRNATEINLSVDSEGTVTIESANGVSNAGVVDGLDASATSDSLIVNFTVGKTIGPTANTNHSADDLVWNYEAAAASSDGSGGTFGLTESSSDPMSGTFDTGALIDVNFNTAQLDVAGSPGDNNVQYSGPSGQNLTVTQQGNIDVSFLTRMTEMTSDNTSDTIPASANKYNANNNDASTAEAFAENRKGVMPGSRVNVGWDSDPGMTVYKWIDMPSGIDPGQYEGTFTYTVEYEGSGD